MIYPVSSGEALSLFRCQTVDDIPYLMADYRIQCYTPAWYSFAIFVVAFLIIFSLGLPAAVALYLRSKEDHLNDAKFRKIFEVFYCLYRKDVYWFESISMYFKLALWSSLVFFEYGSESQMAIALIINLTNLFLQVKLAPFEKPFVNKLQVGVLILTSAVNLTGLALNYLTLARNYVIHVTQTQKDILSLSSQIQTTEFLISMFSMVSMLLLVGSAIWRQRDRIQQIGKLIYKYVRRVKQRMSSSPQESDNAIEMKENPMQSDRNTPHHTKELSIKI